MPEARFLRTLDLDPSEIDVSQRLRPVTDAGVDALVVSIEEAGQIRDAIHVREIAARHDHPKSLVLIAGGHRVAAAARLGIKVPAKIWRCTNDQAALMEIDDQIAGSGMTALDTAVFLGQRKRIYERLHPEVCQKTGAALARMRWNAPDIMSVASFAKATAEQFGLTERHVRRLVAVGLALSSSDINDLRIAPKPVRLNDLMALAKIADGVERSRVCDLIGTGRAATVAKARASLKGVEAPKPSPVDQSLRGLLEAWERAPLAAKRGFVAERADDLARFLGELASELDGAA